MSTFAKSLVLGMILVGATAVAAKAPRTEINNTAVGSVCFPGDTCVKVVSVRGTRPEGVHTFGLQSSSEWVTGVYDARGKVVGQVRKGGDIIVISPEVYARRDAGQATYTLNRIDGKAKPVRTPFVAINASPVRIGWDNWQGQRTSAFGSTKIPPWSDHPDAWAAVGEIGGIAADGSITGRWSDVTTVHVYGDYTVLAHADGKSFTVADDQFRTLSPRLANLRAFTTAHTDTHTDRRARTGIYSRRTVFAAESELPGGRLIYTLLPRQAGGVSPDGLIGLAPILDNHGQGWPCEPLLGPACRRNLMAWVAIWASESGEPRVSVEEPLLQRVSSDRYRAVHWYPYDIMFVAGVVETLEGQFKVLPWSVSPAGTMILSQLPETYASFDAANAAIRAIQDARSAELWAKVLADQEAERQRYAAWAAERAEEDRRAAERAANEARETEEASALIATNDADRICAAAWKAQGFYARNNLFEACSRLRPPAVPQSRGFWGDLAAGLAAYNRSGAAATYTAPSTGTVSSPSNAGDFNRSMQAIDSALRVISDPNWNGAAAASQRQ